MARTRDRGARSTPPAERDCARRTRRRVRGQGREAAGEQVAALCREGADGQSRALGVRGQCLEPVVDRFVGESSDRAVACHGSSSNCRAPRGRCVSCNAHCVFRSALSNIRANAGSMVPGGRPVRSRSDRDRHRDRNRSRGRRLPRRVHGHVRAHGSGAARRRAVVRPGHRRSRVQCGVRARRVRAQRQVGRPGGRGRLRRAPCRGHRRVRRRHSGGAARSAAADRDLLPYGGRAGHVRRPARVRRRPGPVGGRLLPDRVRRLRHVPRDAARGRRVVRPDPAPLRDHRRALRGLPRPAALPADPGARPPARLLRRQLPHEPVAGRRARRPPGPARPGPGRGHRLRRRGRGGSRLGPARRPRDPPGDSRAGRAGGEAGRVGRDGPRTAGRCRTRERTGRRHLRARAPRRRRRPRRRR